MSLLSLLGLNGKANRLLARLTAERAINLDNLDRPVSQCAPASTALLRATWTDALAGYLATAARLQRAEMLTITGTAFPGTLVTVDKTIDPVTPGKCLILPAGDVFTWPKMDSTYTVSLTGPTNVRLVFTAAGTGSTVYTFNFCVLAFQ